MYFDSIKHSVDNSAGFSFTQEKTPQTRTFIRVHDFSCALLCVCLRAGTLKQIRAILMPTMLGLGCH